MIDRRDLIKLGLALPLAAGLPVGALAAGETFDALVIDARYVPKVPRALSGKRVYRLDGDVTPLWTDVLDARWRKPGFVLAGLTGSDMLFVIERLAWDRGRRVVSRIALPGNDVEAGPVIHWVIAPVRPSMVL